MTDLTRSVGMDKTDEIHRECIEGSETVGDPCQGLKNVKNSIKDGHLPPINDPDINQNEQDRGGERSRGASRGSAHRMEARKEDRNSNIEAERVDSTELAKGERTIGTDKAYRESTGDNETVDDPRQDLENDMNPTIDEHLPQAIGSDTDQDDQGRNGKEMARETITINMEADNTNMPRDEDSDLHFDMGNEDGAPESGLTTLDRESTNRVGLTIEVDPPKGLDIPGHRYTANMTTDNAPSGRNSKRHPRIDSGDSEEDTELQDWIEEGRLQGNEAGTRTRSCKRRTGDHARKLAMHMQGGTARIPSEEPEGRGQNTAMPENSRQIAEDSSDATARDQAVNRQ
jgi:hypothetical protein